MVIIVILKTSCSCPTVEALCSCVPLKTIQKNDNRTADDPRCRRSGSESGGRRKGEEEEQPQQEQPQQER